MLRAPLLPSPPHFDNCVYTLDTSYHTHPGSYITFTYCTHKHTCCTHSSRMIGKLDLRYAYYCTPYTSIAPKKAEFHEKSIQQFIEQWHYFSQLHNNDVKNGISPIVTRALVCLQPWKFILLCINCMEECHACMQPEHACIAHVEHRQACV